MPKTNFKLIVTILFTLFFSLTYKAFAFTKYVIYEGNTYRVVSSDILGDEDEREDESEDKEDDKDENKEQDKSREKVREQEKKDQEKAREATKKLQERIKESAKKEIERAKYPEQKIKADIKQEIKLERSRIDDSDENEDENELEDDSIERNVNVARLSQFKKIEIKREDDGRIKIEAEGFGDTFETSESADLLNFIPKGENLDRKLKIKVEKGKLKLESESGKTNTNFPLSIDSTTNTLRIETPSGNVNLVVLPQKAIDNLKEKAGISEVVTSDLETTENLKLKGEGAVYKVKAKKNLKFLGLLDVPGEFEYEVGTQTGDIIEGQKPWFVNIAGFLFK